VTRTLAAIVLISLTLRVGYAVYAIRYPESQCCEVDPDRYREKGSALAPDGRWRWTLDAVKFDDGGSADYIKSPLYQIFLSGFARFTPHYPRYVPIGHALLGALTTIAVFLLARALHSSRAGVIAAATHAVWFLSVVSVTGFWQEQFYIPLATFAAAAFAVSARTEVRAYEDVAGARTEVRAYEDIAGARTKVRAYEDVRAYEYLSGALFAAATLTRSMALWLTPLVLIWRRWRIVAACVAPVAAYVVYLSIALGKPVLVENLTSAYMFLNDPPGVASPHEPSPAFAAPSIVWRQVAADPIWMTRAIVLRVRSTLAPAAHRWLEFHYLSASASGARLARGVVLGSDLMVAIVLVLAPIGIIAAANAAGARFLGLWIAAALLLTSLAGHNGARFRAPLDPMLIALAACVVVRSPTAVRRAKVGLAVARSAKAAGHYVLLVASVCVAANALSTVPHALRVRGDYGVAPWQQDDRARWTRMTRQDAGFGVHPVSGTFTVRIRCAEPAVLTLQFGDRPIESAGPSQCAEGFARKVDATVYTFVRLSVNEPVPVEVAVDDDHISSELMAASWGTHLAFQPLRWFLAGSESLVTP
jgi:hypothetical protein